MDDSEVATKTETAYRTLRQEILETRLQPGAPLKLGALRDAYGIGWTPLREALSRLEAEHLVISSANKGYTVAPVSMAELSDLTNARRLVELPMLAESIANGDEEWETQLVAAHFRLSRCKPPVENPEELVISDWEERHEAFHHALLAASKSQWLMRFYVQIKDQLRRHHRILAITPGLAASKGPEWRDSAAFHSLRDALAIEPHTELMNAALDHDVDKAVALLGAHIELTKQVFSVADFSKPH
ncbi:GntR family transcriptional regulator [Mesorhizobium sp. ANAO-SY3R2]|uniref:GntR family transcriptional regulator n=1 Tax=Mesorhizobium sp. ANAO-SY3R2 TaxID=3166644 RepID=UPI00366AB8F4